MRLSQAPTFAPAVAPIETRHQEGKMPQDQQQHQQQNQPGEERGMPVSTEERIRTRAYYLWEQATDPKGGPDEYWEQARNEIENDAPEHGSTPKKGVLPTPTAKEKP
jgi:hypothetical protein